MFTFHLFFNLYVFFFFFKQKTAYEMRISDWSSDVCSSDLRFETLTAREVQVMREIALGRLNKLIAFDLGISEITVKLHRGNVMKKMKAWSVGELIRAWEKIPAALR